MYIRLFGLVVVIALIVYAARTLKPTRFGLVLGLLMFYMPMHFKIPLNALPIVNALTVGVVALVVLMPADRGTLARHARAFRALTLGFCGLSAMGLAIAAGQSSGHFMETVAEFKRWLDPVVFGLLALTITRDEDRKFAIACMLLSYAIVAVHGIREGIDYGVHKRPPGLLGQPNETGAFLAMYAPFGLTLALLVLRGYRRMVLIGVVVLGGIALIPTLSRGAWIAYALSMMVALVATRRRGLAVLSLVLAVGVASMPELLPERVTARFEETVVKEAGGDDELEDKLEASAAARITQWKASLTAMSTNPIGVGFGQFKKAIARYGGIGGLDAHNFFLLVGAEFGIVAFFVAIALFVNMASNAWAVAQGASDPFMRCFGCACCAMIVAAVTVNCFGSRLMQDQPSTFLWVLSAMAARARDVLPAPRPRHLRVAS